jgi:(2Fe-2S) ferredoxin
MADVTLTRSLHGDAAAASGYNHDMVGSVDDDTARYELWICRGRVCSANGSDAVAAAFGAAMSSSSSSSEARSLSSPALERVTLHSGGCYGLCELGPNVVVRRRRWGDQPSAEAADRLSLTEGPDETVYCVVDAADAPAIVRSHLEHDVPLAHLTRAVRECERAPRTPVEERIRRLRAERSRRDAAASRTSADDEGESS